MSRKDKSDKKVILNINNANATFHKEPRYVIEGHNGEFIIKGDFSIFELANLLFRYQNEDGAKSAIKVYIKLVDYDILKPKEKTMIPFDSI